MSCGCALVPRTHSSNGSCPTTTTRPACGAKLATGVPSGSYPLRSVNCRLTKAEDWFVAAVKFSHATCWVPMSHWLAQAMRLSRWNELVSGVIEDTQICGTMGWMLKDSSRPGGDSSVISRFVNGTVEIR